MMLNEPYIWESWSKRPGFKNLIKPPSNRESKLEKQIREQNEHPCLIEEFFKREREEGRNTKSVMISCDCPKCRIHC